MTLKDSVGTNSVKGGKKEQETGEVTQGFRALTALAENQGLVPSTCITVLGGLMSSFGHCEHCTYVMYIHACKHS